MPGQPAAGGGVLSGHNGGGDNGQRTGAGVGWEGDSGGDDSPEIRKRHAIAAQAGMVRRRHCPAQPFAGHSSLAQAPAGPAFVAIGLGEVEVEIANVDHAPPLEARGRSVGGWVKAVSQEPGAFRARS